MNNTTKAVGHQKGCMGNHDYRDCHCKNYVVISPWGWGKGSTADEAKKNCWDQRPNSQGWGAGGFKRDATKGQMKVYLVHPETVVYGDGSWDYPKGHAPKEVVELTPDPAILMQLLARTR